MYWELHAILGGLTFLLGSVVGSFLNVCIYRIPWQKSVIWPESRCPCCMAAILPRDNIPILGWLVLGGACRNCRKPISARYPSIEFLVGALFLGIYLLDVAATPRAMIGPDPAALAVRAAYHLILVALLVTATFIDFDLFVIPDEVTVPGMIFGLGLPLLMPGIRPEPSWAATPAEAMKIGLVGWAVGGGLIWAIRIFGRLAFRREAMGFGDVTLMAMIGAFLGWQATILIPFLASILGLAHALVKLVGLIGKWISGRSISGADREIPFGPYLSMAALLLLFTWPRLWPGWARPFFESLASAAWFLMGFDG